MSKEEAIKIVKAASIEFEIEESGFGDGSCVISNKYVCDSEEEAKQLVEAMNVLLLLNKQ